MRRLLAVLVALGALGALALVGAAPATSGSSTIPFHARLGAILGMIPPVNEQGSAISNSAPASGSLYYNGGPVMTTSNVYTIYWQPSGYKFPSGYSSLMNRYFSDLQATNGKNTNTYVNATQYYQQQNGGAPQYVQNHTNFAGTAVDTSPLPALDPVNCPDTPVAAAGGVNGSSSTTAGCVTDAQVQQEISSVVKSHGWPVSNTTEFFMFTAPNIGTCFPATVGEEQSGVQTTVTAPLCSFSYFCAYHSAYYDSTINSSSQVIYSNMPYAAQTAGNPVTCDLGSYPNHNPADAEISVTSHEHNESITDPFGTGWWDSNPNDSAAGEENGDMCAWDFGNLKGPDGAQYDQTINGHHYLMQLEWDNTTNGCPGSDASGNPVPTQANYDTPELTLTPASGYPTAPFKMQGLFFSAGDSVANSFTDSGVTTALGTVTANASGRTSFTPRVPKGSKPGSATATVTGSSGSATAQFTVLSR